MTSGSEISIGLNRFPGPIIVSSILIFSKIIKEIVMWELKMCDELKKLQVKKQEQK